MPIGVNETARLVAAGKLEAEKVVGHALHAVQTTGAELNAFVEARPQAMVEARSASGPLAGVPVALKDMFGDGGRAPTCGSGSTARWATETALIVDRLRAAGAAIVGYSNLHEWGIGTTSTVSATGPILNPWDKARIAGGSSGGSAAAVAAGIVPAGIGTDAGGSIRVPAACCGVVGFKPTWGLVPLAGFAEGEDGPPVDHAGPLARSVDDVKTLLEVLSATKLDEPDPSTLRVGVLRHHFFDDLDPGVAAAVESCIAGLEAHVASISDAELPNAAAAGQALPVLLLSHTAALVREDLEARPNAFQPQSLNLLMLGAGMSPDDLRAADDVRRGLRTAWDELFQDVDVVVTPTIPAPPARSDMLTVELPSGTASAELAQISLNAPMNLGGVPALSVPCGEVDTGLSVSVTVTAARGNDAAALALGRIVERVTDERYVGRVAVQG